MKVLIAQYLDYEMIDIEGFTKPKYFISQAIIVHIAKKKKANDLKMKKN